MSDTVNIPVDRYNQLLELRDLALRAGLDVPPMPLMQPAASAQPAAPAPRPGGFTPSNPGEEAYLFWLNAQNQQRESGYSGIGFKMNGTAVHPPGR